MGAAGGRKSPDGVLLVDKPGGCTSFDVVQRVRRICGTRSVGHCGTLDPMATGLLVVCVGDATRLVPFLQDGEKTYEALVRFGATTDTLDADGTVTSTLDPSGITEDRVLTAVTALVGTQLQKAPMYSARSVDGKRLHELARAGLEVDREARPITIHAATLLSWHAPDAAIRIRCSKGTYIRVLASEIGDTLGPGAHLAALRRTASGGFDVAAAATLDTLQSLDFETLSTRVIPVEVALAMLPELRLDERAAAAVGYGNALDAARLASLGLVAPASPAFVRLTDPAGLVVAVGESRPDGSVSLARVLRARTGPGLYRPKASP